MKSPRRIAVTWPWILGISLMVSGLPLSQACGGEATPEQPAGAPAEKKPEAPAEPKAAPAPAEKPAAATGPAGLVGTVVAVEPNSQTLVVNVPLSEDVLTVGASATDTTRITAGGKKVSFGSLKQGDRVRIVFRRVPTGDVLTAVTVLREPKA